jgi:hypothetical protein
LLLPGQLDDLHAALGLARAPSLVRAQILARLCWALKREDRYAESEGMALDLRALAEQLGDEEHRIEADMALASLGALRGEDTMAALRGAQEAAERAGFGLLEAWAYLTITNALEGGGRHELAIPAGREGLARARQLGLGRQIAAPIAGNLAESLTSAGRWNEALEILDEVLGLDLSPLGRFGPLVIRAQIAVARGDQETAERMLDELRSLPAGVQAESQRLLSLARIEIDARLARGDLAGALDAGRTALIRDVPADPRYLWPLLATAMRACAETSAVSLPPEACDPGRLRRDLELRAGSTDRAGPVHDAWAATFAAEAARTDASAEACADNRPDLAGWDAAASAWAALAQPQQEAYALLRAAGAASAAGNRKARPPGSAARPIWPVRLGARPLLEQIGSLARRARVDVPALPGPRGQSGPGEPRRSGLPSANSKCCAWWPLAAVTATSPPSSSSRPRRPACTCPTSSASSASARVARPPRRPTGSTFWTTANRRTLRISQLPDGGLAVTSRHPPVENWATDFDHTDPAWVADPYPIWEDLRQRCPVAHSDRYGGTWLPVTHELVSEVAYDTENFTSRSVVVSEERPGPDDLPAPIGLSPPITSDPPFHAMARGMLLPAFGPRATAALEPFTRELCRELLAETEGRASFDAAIEYAQHIPVRVIVRFLGFPQEDADRFRRFIRLVLEEVNMPAEDEEREAMFGELDAYMDAQIDDHIAHPRDDLTSFLIGAEIAAAS